MSTPRVRANGEGSLFAYRNGYAAYVWVTTPAGGRERKWIYGQDRDELHGRWIDLQKQTKSGPVATKVPKLGDYLTYWLQEIVAPNLAPLTYATYETLTRLYIVPGLGGKRLDKLTVRDVQTWLNKVWQSCQCCAQGKDTRRPETARRCCAVGKCCGAVPSLRTVSDLRTVLRSALSSATREELITKNVVTMTQLPARRRRKRKPWSSDEARAFLESVRRDDNALYAAYVLILVLGLRKGEVLGLTWPDVDLDAAELTIGRQLQRVRGELLHRETKTEASDATLPLPPVCVTALRQRQAVQDRARETAGAAWTRSELVFTTRYGDPIEPRNFNRYFTARCEAAGVRQITVHDARRTCATLLVDLDVHPRIVMQILRHAQFDVTMEVYASASSAATREALKRLGASLDG
ncbi:MAG: site-specific integrase [Pseudonocardiales bacterium]|nr:site-specific integrase [Pseudonocardiales bacterium]